MSNMINYIGPKESWDQIWVIIGKYLKAPNIPLEVREKLRKAEASITEVPRTPTDNSGSLAMRDIKIGSVYRFRPESQTNQRQGLAGLTVQVNTKKRTRVSATILDEPSVMKWSKGQSVDIPISLLTNV